MTTATPSRAYCVRPKSGCRGDSRATVHQPAPDPPPRRQRPGACISGSGRLQLRIYVAFSASFEMARGNERCCCICLRYYVLSQRAWLVKESCKGLALPISLICSVMDPFHNPCSPQSIVFSWRRGQRK